MPEPTVFLIEDDEAVLASLSVLLEISGMKTKSYLSAETFLSELTAGATGCIITDLKLSGMSGIQLQEHLYGLNCQLPIVIVTGRVEADMEARIMDRGAVALLRKPYDPRQLLAAARQALERNAELQQQ